MSVCIISLLHDVIGYVPDENLLFPNGPNESTVYQVFPPINFGCRTYLLEYNCSSLVSLDFVGYDKDTNPPVILVPKSAQSSIATRIK